MKFEMMAIDRNRQLESCRRFLVMQLESVQKLLEMGISEEAYQEVMGMFCNHATHLYVCGLIDEEFYRFIFEWNCRERCYGRSGRRSERHPQRHCEVYRLKKIF